MTPGLDQADRALRRATRGLAVVGVTALLLQAGGIVLDALLRSVFGAPIHGLEDINLLLIPITVSSFLPVLVMERGNITVDLLGRALNKTMARLFGIFGHLLAFGFLLLLALYYGFYAFDLGGQHTVIVEIPTRPGALIATGFLALAALLQGFVFLHSLLAGRRS